MSNDPTQFQPDRTDHVRQEIERKLEGLEQRIESRLQAVDSKVNTNTASIATKASSNYVHLIAASAFTVACIVVGYAYHQIDKIHDSETGFKDQFFQRLVRVETKLEEGSINKFKPPSKA